MGDWVVAAHAGEMKRGERIRFLEGKDIEGKGVRDRMRHSSPAKPFKSADHICPLPKTGGIRDPTQ